MTAIKMHGAAIACAMLLLSSSALAAVVQKGDLLFLDGNTLLATSPTGKTRATIQLASDKKGPLNVDGFDEDGKQRLVQAYPGSVSQDGLYSFNPANDNSKASTNTSQIAAVLIVTDLVKGKVKQKIAVPSPGLPKGTNFNFQANYVPPADQGDLETNLGYNARNYVAAGYPVNNQYPLYIIISAWSCKKFEDGEPLKQQFYTKYTYNAATGQLKWAGLRIAVTSDCPKEGNDLLEGKAAFAGRALGVSKSTGYFIAGSLRLAGPERLEIYKTSGNTLKSIFKTPKSEGDYLSKLTLLKADAQSNYVKVAGAISSFEAADKFSKIRLLGDAGSKSAPSSQLAGLKLKKGEEITALANNNGALYAVTQQVTNDSFSKSVTIIKITPSSLNVAGGKATPASAQRVFTLPSKYSDSLAVVGSQA